jgi:hypothetical protein
MCKMVHGWSSRLKLPEEAPLFTPRIGCLTSGRRSPE